MTYERDVEKLYDGIDRIQSNPSYLPTKYKFLEVETKLVRPKNWDISKAPVFSEPLHVAQFVADLLKELEESDRERLFAVLLDNSNRVVGLHPVTVGEATGTLAPPKELFRAAILAGAVAIIFIHNHPSGKLEFSLADMQIVKRLVQVGKILDIKVLDFMVIGIGGQYVSAQGTRPGLLRSDVLS